MLSVSVGPKLSTEQLIQQVAAIYAEKNIEIRREKGKEIFQNRFDFEKFAQLTLEDHWKHLKPAQRRAFLAVFKERFEERVLDYFKKEPAKFSVTVTKEGRFGNFRKVDCRWESNKKTGQFSLLWVLEEGKNGKVVDVWVSNASLVGNYQGQFNKIIRDHGFDEVLRRLKVSPEKFSAR